MKWIKEYKRNYIKNLIKIQNCPIIVFGCGCRGKQLYTLLEETDYQMDFFIDNREELWNTYIDKTKILEPKVCTQKYPNANYIIAVKDKYDEIAQQLLTLGIDKYQISYFEHSMTEIQRLAMIEAIKKNLKKEYVVDENYAKELGYIGVKECNKDNRYIRVLLDKYMVQKFDGVAEDTELDYLKDFEKTYGKYQKIEHFNCLNTLEKKDSFKILVACCHTDQSEFKCAEEYLVPIQVGASLTTKVLYPLTDNIGENISERNYNYCECTALYWAWKNRWVKDLEYIGLRHYRRRLVISQEQLASLKENKIDIVLMEPTYIADIQGHFSACTKNENDWFVLKQTIEKCQPNYKETFTRLEKQNFLCQCNMFVMRRDLYDTYCEFLFSILMEVERYYLVRIDRKDRYLGYLGEVLLSLFVMHNSNDLKIAYADMQRL